MRKSGTRVRIVAQLIETETGAHIWADRYEGDLRDVFALQDEITERVVSAVEMNVRDAEIKRARAKPTESLTAYDLYLRALPAWFGQTEVDYRRTQVLLGKAIEVDPDVCRGSRHPDRQRRHSHSAGLARELVSRSAMRLRQLAGRALAAGPDNSTCLASAAFTYGVLSYRFEEAFDLADRAVMLHPNSVFVRNRAAAVYVVCGESRQGDRPMRGGPPHEPARQQEGSHRHLRGPLVRTLPCAPLRGIHPAPASARWRSLRKSIPPASTSPYPSPSLAASTRRGPRSPSSSSTSPTLRSHSSSFKVSATSGCSELHMEGLRKAGLREK